MLAAKTAEDIDDPRKGSGSEDRDVMNDRKKPETASTQAANPAREKARVGYFEPEDAEHNIADGKQRARPSEPYLTWLGHSLRQSYEETLNEPVPDAFRDLLNRLEQEDDKPA